MDENIDMGQIIDRIEIEKYFTDTSETLYKRILLAEIYLLEKNIVSILNKNFTPFSFENEGNIFFKKDFKTICKLNLDENGSFLNFYNRLRALSHGNYKNAYFINPENGKKVYIKIEINEEADDNLSKKGSIK